MNFFRKILFCVFCLFALSANLPTFAFGTEKWTEVRSENFHLVGNASAEEINQVAAKLEQFRFVFTKIFKQFNFSSPIPTTVLVFKDDQSFLKFKPLNEQGQPKDFVKGYFLPGTDLNYIALSAEANRAADFTTIYHEYVHFLIDNTLGRNNIPPWLNEGFAEYYEQFKTEKNRIVLGAENPAHSAILKKNGLMPLDKFFAVDYYTLQRQPKENVIQFYAQAWALIHFFRHDSEGARKAELDNFAKLLTKGIAANQAFRESFGLSYEELEKALKKYVEKKSFETNLIEAAADFSPPVKTKSNEISEADSLAYLGDLLLHANRVEESEKLLLQSLSLNPESSLANTSMGFLKVKAKNFTEARKYLEKGVQNDTNNFYAQFGYAYLLSREGMSDFGFIINYMPSTADRIRAGLRKAIQLNPSYAESYHLFAFVNYVQNQNLDEGLEMIEKALQIAPGNQWYQIRKAELLMRKLDFAAARAIALKAIQTAADDQLKLYSINTLNLINNWEAQLESAKNAEKDRENPAVTEKPLSEEEILRLNQIALRESLNQALRKPRFDEKRVLGFVVKADCEANQVVFSFKNAGQTFKIKSDSFTDVIFVSFTANRAGTVFGCNTQKSEQFAVITYRPHKSGISDLIGEAVAIEFVPENFTFLEAKPER